MDGDTGAGVRRLGRPFCGTQQCWSHSGPQRSNLKKAGFSPCKCLLVAFESTIGLATPCVTCGLAASPESL